MRRANLLVLIDALAFTCFLLLVSSGVLLEYLLPAGSGRWLAIWSLSRHEWGEIHFWLATVFLSVLAVHLFLHWRFLAGVLLGRTRPAPAWRPWLGLLALLALLALAAAPLLSTVEQPARPGDPRGGVHGHRISR